ncbi:hypothetical protein [Thioalkalivibrio sp. ALE19]|uniref:hypothetical protein n=1 Tax=Thioalkalivibrio sp. ALE19 TaxID=1266909 RepID=UPI00048B1B08|nr:hypothetical protein [Thioalkalivibrio sp. ALE19]
MNDITFSDALRKQLRDPEAYLEQVGNVLFGLFRVLGWWVIMTTTYTSAAAIFAFITQDLSAYSRGDLQEGLRVICTFAGGAAALACLFGNTGRFRDVFSARAWDEVERFQSIKEKIESQIDTTEVLLVKHGLITESDVERRAATVSGTSSTT